MRRLTRGPATSPPISRCAALECLGGTGIASFEVLRQRAAAP